MFDHFEVTLFPLIIQLPHDHYILIRDYFFPQLTKEKTMQSLMAEHDGMSIIIQMYVYIPYRYMYMSCHETRISHESYHILLC